MHLNRQGRRGTVLALAMACGAAAYAAERASADVLAEYNFNSFGDAVSNPSVPNSATATGVTLANLERDPGGTGNADGLGTITAVQTRDPTPDTFTSTALAVGVGTTARNPFHATTPTDIVAEQDYVTFTLTSNADGVSLDSFTFDYGLSVNPSDTTGLLSGAQLFYNLNGTGFTAVGARQDRTVPGDAPGFFTGFTNSVIDLSSLPTLSSGDMVEFRLSFGDNSSQGTTQKAAYIDNLVLNGVVPEPSSLALLGLAGMGLVRRNRRA